VEVNDEAILSLITKRVRETLIRFNDESTLPCEVQISIGSALYVPGDDIDDLRDKAKRASSALEYVNRLDAAMYAEKAQKRILRGNVQSCVSA
jgi:GGDEF domain-containing protein